MKRSTTKKKRDKFYAASGLVNRTPEEAKAYLEMIKEQGRQALLRGARIKAQIDEFRMMVADEKNPQAFDLRKVTVAHNTVSTMGLSPIPDGPLADQIAAMTKDFFDQPAGEYFSRNARKKPS